MSIAPSAPGVGGSTSKYMPRVSGLSCHSTNWSVIDRPVITDRSGTADCHGVRSVESVDWPTVGPSSDR